MRVQTVAMVLGVLLSAGCGSSSTGGQGDGGLRTDGGPDSGSLACGALLDCGGACVDVSTEPEQCGRCGHSCLGGACAAGVCQPVVLASDDSFPVRMRVSGGWVYWSSDSLSRIEGKVQRVSVDGGAIEPIAQGLLKPGAIEVGGDELYWLTQDPDGGVMHAPLDGGAAELLIRGPVSNSIQLRDGRLFWSEAGALVSALPDGGDRSPFIAAGTPTAFAFDGPYVYWGDVQAKRISRAFPDGGALEPLVSSPSPSRLAVVGNTLYWVDVSAADGGVYAADLQSGSIRELGALVQQNVPELPLRVSDLALDESYVYWSDLTAGIVYRSPLDGGASEPLIQNQPRPVSVAVDAKAIYWTTLGNADGGAIWKLAK